MSGLSISDGGYILAGQHDSPRQGVEFWLVKTIPDTTHINGVILLDPAFPSQFVVGTPYPNPFNSSIQLNYSLPYLAQTSIRIYNQLGHQVAELYNGRLEAGQHTLTWDGFDSERTPVSSGIYLIRLTAGSLAKTGQMTLIR